MPPPSVVQDQSGVPWHMREYEIYQPPSFVARTPPRYYNFHLLPPHARGRLQRELALACSPVRLPSVVSTRSIFSGVGSGIAGGSVRSSLSTRRPSMLASARLASAGGKVGLETITASPASTAAPLHSPSLDPMNALNAGPAANHRLSTWLKRPPASPHTSSMRPLPADATDLMDGTDPFGRHYSSLYDAGEMVVGRRTRDSPDGSPRRSIAGPSRKGTSPLSQSTSAINLADEPPLPEPPGSPDLLSGTRTKRQLSKRRSTSASRGGLSSLFKRKLSADGDQEGRTGGLRGRSRPPLSPSSHSLAQRDIAFPTAREKRPRRKLSESLSRSPSVASVDSSQSIETPIHTGLVEEVLQDVDIVESNNHQRERNLSVSSFNSLLSRITSGNLHSKSAQDLCKVPPDGHRLRNHVGKDHKSGNLFTRFGRKLSLIRRGSVDVFGNPEHNSSKASFIVNRQAAMLTRRATLDLSPSQSPTTEALMTVPAPSEEFDPWSIGPLFAPIDPRLRLSRLIHPRLSPPPPIPDLSLQQQGGGTSQASFHHKVVSTKSPDPPMLSTDELLPPPLIGAEDPHLPHSILKWGIQPAKTGSLSLESGSPTEDLPISVTQGVLTVVDEEGEKVAVHDPCESVDRLKALRAQLDAAAAASPQGLDREVSPEGTRPLVIGKDVSRSPSPDKPLSGRESPLGRVRGSPVRLGKRDQSPAKPVQRTESLNDHSAVNEADVRKLHGFGPIGISMRSSSVAGSAASVDAVHGSDVQENDHIQDNDDTEFDARPPLQEDPTGPSSKLADAKDCSTRMAPTGDHPFSKNPVEYQNVISSTSVVLFRASSPPPGAFTDDSPSKAFAGSKDAWMHANDEFSVSREKLVAQGEFKRAHNKRESTTGGERENLRGERARWRAEELECLERERLQPEHAERGRMRAQRQREEQERMERIARERDRERVEIERMERIARERDRERVEMERQELERQESKREREWAELTRLEWERTERDRLMEEEMRRREPPALLPSYSSRRIRQEVEGERAIIITNPKGLRRSKRRIPNKYLLTSLTSTVPSSSPPPPLKGNQPAEAQKHSQTDVCAPPITSVPVLAYTNPNRRPQGRPSRSRNPLPDPPRVDVCQSHEFGLAGTSMHSSAIVNKHTNLVGAIHGGSDAELGVRPYPPQEDPTGRRRMVRPRAIGEMHVATKHVVGTSQCSNEPVDILQSDTPYYAASVIYECLMERGCPDLMSLIDPEGFSSSAVAEGGFGDIWKGRFHDSRKLAIKVLRFACLTGDNKKKELKRFAREIYHWSKLDHENVNKLMGVIMFQERLGMVSEWMEHGNLRQYLNRNSSASRPKLCIQIAKGVVYLHGVNMIHGDLKACNILVSSTGILKITDFDFSIYPECSLAFSATSRNRGGTLRWMAPELVVVVEAEPPQRNAKTDIYALGMTFLETITNAHPFCECRHDHQIYGKLERKDHPQRSESYFPDTEWGTQMWSLLLQCWDFNPVSRPTADGVLRSLLTLENEATYAS